MGQATTKLKFIVAYRAGLMQPATLVQQINTLSGLIGGRVALNIVAGSDPVEQRGYGDFLEHDERYARAEEYLAICHSFWRNKGRVDFDGKYCRVEGGKLLTPFTAPDRTAPEDLHLRTLGAGATISFGPRFLLVTTNRHAREARARW